MRISIPTGFQGHHLRNPIQAIQMKCFLITSLLSLILVSFWFAQAIKPGGNRLEAQQDESEVSTSHSMPNRLWRTEFSKLVGSPAVMGDQIVVTTTEGSRPRYFLRGIASDGQPKWKRRISTPQKINVPSMRIVVGGERIFVVNNEEIQVFNENGKSIWEKSLQKTRGQGSFQILARKNHGSFSTSLTQAFYAVTDRRNRPRNYRRTLHVAFQHAVVFPEWTERVDHIEVYCDLDGAKSLCSSHCLMHSTHSNNAKAGPFSKETFSSICSADFALFSDMRVTIYADGFSLTPGHFRWNKKVVKLESVGWKDPNENFSIATTDCVDGHLVLWSDDRFSAIILKFDEEAFGPAAKAREIEGADNYGLFPWCFPHDTSIVSVLQYDNLVYLMDEKGWLICLDPATRKECYRKRLTMEGHASTPVASKGKIYVTGRNGQVAIVESGPNFRLDSEFELNEETVGSPIFHDGVIYIGTTKALYAFGVSIE